MQGTHAVIYLPNLRHNLDIVKKLHPIDTAICLAVKADAYGHGAVAIAREAESWGVDCLGVARVSEARILREAGIGIPILLYSLPMPDELEEALLLNLDLFLGDSELIKSTARKLTDLKARHPDMAANHRANVHLKVDTGMGRIGCQPQEALALARSIKETPELNLRGIATHLPVADGNTQEHRDFTRNQLVLFDQVVKRLSDEGIRPPLVHGLNSAGILEYPEFRFTMVRPGIMAYGYPPGKHQQHLANLLPIMELRTSVSYIKEVPPGRGLSYGHTYVTPGLRRIATLPVGYADGLFRGLSNRIQMTTSQGAAAQVGTICMDQCLLDLGPGGSGEHPGVNRYDQVVIFGPKAFESAQTLAEKLETIPYEITCAISKRVPRVYRD